jgi:phage tail-like protein
VAAPLLDSALPLDGLRIRVTWDSEVKAEDAAESDDALNLSNYTIAASTVPAVPLVVTAVAPVYVGSTLVPEQFDLTLDWDQTPGASYSLAAANVVGVVGTTYTAPTPGTPTAPFTGFVPAAPAGRRFSLLGMVPQRNRSLDLSGDVQKLIACWQDPVTLLLSRVDRFAEITDIDRCSADCLDALLYDMGNPFPFVMTDIQKRKLLGVLEDVYKQKGTAIGIINTLRFFLGVEATIRCVARDETWEIPLCRLGGEDTVGQAVTVPDPTNDRLTLAAACLFETDDPVEFETTDTLPAPLVAGEYDGTTWVPRQYFVRDVSGSTFKLAAAPGGSVLDITDSGTGVHTVFNRDPGTCMCGPDYNYDTAWLFGFEVLLDRALTDAERVQALQVIDYMRIVNAPLLGLYEAGVKTWP